MLYVDIIRVKLHVTSGDILSIVPFSYLKFPLDKNYYNVSSDGYPQFLIHKPLCLIVIVETLVFIRSTDQNDSLDA
jgi:hypothetical protein